MCIFIQQLGGVRREGCAPVSWLKRWRGKDGRGERPLFKAPPEETFLRLVNSRRMQMRATSCAYALHTHHVCVCVCTRVFVFTHSREMCVFFASGNSMRNTSVFHSDLVNYRVIKRRRHSLAENADDDVVLCKLIVHRGNEKNVFSLRLFFISATTLFLEEYSKYCVASFHCVKILRRFDKKKKKLSTF